MTVRVLLVNHHPVVRAAARARTSAGRLAVPHTLEKPRLYEPNRAPVPRSTSTREPAARML